MFVCSGFAGRMIDVVEEREKAVDALMGWVTTRNESCDRY